jgi:hypothetical protein
LSWYRAEGDPDLKEGAAIGNTLYFGADGKFGMFRMYIVRNGNKMGLDEGGGGRIFCGEWSLTGDTVKVRYRLVDAYKLILPSEQQPKVPGALEEHEIALSVFRTASPELHFWERRISRPWE